MLAGMAVAIGTGAIGMMGASSDLFGRATPGPERITAAPGAVAVVDGDTLRLDGRVIRLRGIEAPPRGESCGAVDCGGQATTSLAALVRDRQVECLLDGRDRMGRPLAACDVNGSDLSAAVVRSGWARAQPGAASLDTLEQDARQHRAGLWATRHTP